MTVAENALSDESGAFATTTCGTTVSEAKNGSGRLSFVAINGSERAGGNCDLVCEATAGILRSYAIDFDWIALRDFEIAPCGTCGECNTRTEACAVSDDMPHLINRVAAADALIYVAPVHGYGLSATMQTFIERAGVGYLRFRRPLENHVGGAVVVGRRYGLVSAHNQIVNNLLLNRMILVGSGYPTTLQGGRPGKALEDAEGMASLRSLISRMAGMARLLSSAPQHAALLKPETVNEREPMTAYRSS